MGKDVSTNGFLGVCLEAEKTKSHFSEIKGPAVLSLVERLPSFRGYFLYMSTFGWSFVGRFSLFQSVLYRRFHCTEV